MKPAAHRTPAPAGKASEEYDQPVCWVPMNMDNSSGGQVYVTSDKWGPFNGQPLFMSYGKCTLFHMMTEEVDGVTQGGMVQFPLKFNSGLMRARFNPKDGQFYGCGLKGWQTSAARDGGFFRVRYTGAPVNDPVGLRAKRTAWKFPSPTPSTRPAPRKRPTGVSSNGTTSIRAATAPGSSPSPIRPRKVTTP